MYSDDAGAGGTLSQLATKPTGTSLQPWAHYRVSFSTADSILKKKNLRRRYITTLPRPSEGLVAERFVAKFKDMDTYFSTYCKRMTRAVVSCNSSRRYPDHLLLDSAPNLGPLISRREINKFENFWYESVRILEVLKLLFQQFLNLSKFRTRYEWSNIRRHVQ